MVLVLGRICVSRATCTAVLSHCTLSFSRVEDAVSWKSMMLHDISHEQEGLGEGRKGIAAPTPKSSQGLDLSTVLGPGRPGVGE